MNKPHKRGNPSTSWQPVGKWYDKSVGFSGSYYHQHTVIPGTLRLLRLEETPRPSLLDLACGQGVLARALGKSVEYHGVDIAPGLIAAAKRMDHSPLHHYTAADAAAPLPIEKSDFTHAAVVLALQNIAAPQKVLANARERLRPGGRIVLVLNHPCFRIPRQSSWEVDPHNKLQFRRINRYLSPLKIPIKAHPSAGERSPVTFSFHHPLSDYSRWLRESGFVIELIEEWASDKVSEGKAARMENLSRAEFPLFLAIAARLERKAGPMETRETGPKQP